MEKIYDRCSGIDVHKKVMVVCFRHGRESEIRRFGTTTSELLELGNWLKENGCEMSAMESTGSYWKPLYNVLEFVGLNAMVVNAQHMKAVPGRKTDVKDAEWIADLLQHGLLKASYIPDKPQRELRELLNYRKSLVQDKARELNRLQKMLEGANIKLSGTISDINGKSGRNLLNELVSGTRIDEKKLREMKAEGKISSRLKADEKQLVEDLNGVLSKLQRKMLKELLEHIDEIEVHIQNLDIEIDDNMDNDQKAASKKLEKIPGIGSASAKSIISVIGTDMSRFPSDAHLSSWAGLCPGNNESAGKRRSGKTRKGNQLLRTTLILCAHASVRSKKTYFHAQFERISARRGKKRAYVAVAHSILIAIYHVLTGTDGFVDLGADYYNQFNKERKINAYLKKLSSLGWNPPAVAAP